MIQTLEEQRQSYERTPLGQLTFESYLNFYILVIRHARLAFLVQDNASLRPNRLAVLRDQSAENID